MKIKYNRHKCIGCGICIAGASHIWQLSAVDGKADLMDSEYAKDHFFRVLWPDEERVMDKITALCPTKAFQLF